MADRQSIAGKVIDSARPSAVSALTALARLLARQAARELVEGQNAETEAVAKGKPKQVPK